MILQKFLGASKGGGDNPQAEAVGRKHELKKIR
jgi:hypothetical protein